MQKLTAEGCGIEDIQWLSTLTKLTNLKLRDNNIETIDALSNLSSLKELALSGNLVVKDFSFDKLKDITLKINSYKENGGIASIRADLTGTAPPKIYLKYEKYRADGVLIKALEVLGEQVLFGKSVVWDVPEMFDASDGYVVISGYERPDFQQLCTETVIYPMRFSF